MDVFVTYKNYKVNIMKNKYSFLAMCKLVFWVFRTKFICIKARLIRFPIDLRGLDFIELGTNLTTGVGCRLEAFAQKGNKILIFGKDVQINDYVHICAMEKISIGDNVLIASHVYISDSSHGCYKGCNDDSSPKIPPIKRDYYKSPICIGKNVWIGEGVIIMPGVVIGDGAIIGAHSIVNTNIEANSIAVGSPAKIIKKYNFSSQQWERVQ